jgi:hypothetical protein
MTIALFFTDALSPGLVGIVSLLWGLLLYGIGLGQSSWITKRRLPEILNWVQV